MNTQEQEEAQKKEEEYEKYYNEREQFRDKLEICKLKIKIIDILSKVSGIKSEFICDMFDTLKEKNKNNENVANFMDNLINYIKLINNTSNSSLNFERLQSLLRSTLYNFNDKNVLICVLYCIDDNKEYNEYTPYIIDSCFSYTI